MKRLAPAVLVAVAVAAAASVAAGRAASPTAVRLTPLGSIQFPDRAFILSSTSGPPLSNTGIHVTENGKDVRKFSAVPASSTLSRTFGVVLVIDTSNSMRGQPIVNAMAGARAFQTRSPGAQAIGVVTFNRAVRVLVPPTTDREAVAAALEGQPTLAEKTHLWDGISRAIDVLRQKKVSAGSIVVLTDGRDIGSQLSFAQIESKAKKAGIRIFPVGLLSSQYTPGPLQRIARDTNGAYVEAASPSALTAIYDDLSAKFAREYLVRYRSDLGPGRPVRVDVTAGSPPDLVTWRYVTPIPDSVPPFHRSFFDRFVASSGSVALVVLLAGAIAWIAVSTLLRPGRSTVQARVGEFMVPAGTTLGADSASSTERRISQVFLGAERALERSSWWKRFTEELEIGEFPMRPGPLAALTAISSLLLAFIGGLISPVLVLLAFVPPLIVRAAYKRKLRIRREAFEEQLPNNLNVLAAAMRAGHSFVGGLSTVLDEADEPSRSELRRAIADEQLGVPVEDALFRVAARMDSADLEQVALVASLQREAGGNTAEVLDVIVESLRERFKIRRLVNTLTAQGRLARWILAGLPLAVAAWIGIINPGYLSPLFHTPTGQVMLVVAILMVCAGFVVISKITRIEL
jgi:tight adherence protein B